MVAFRKRFIRTVSVSPHLSGDIVHFLLLTSALHSFFFVFTDSVTMLSRGGEIATERVNLWRSAKFLLDLFKLACRNLILASDTIVMYLELH